MKILSVDKLKEKKMKDINYKQEWYKLKDKLQFISEEFKIFAYHDLIGIDLLRTLKGYEIIHKHMSKVDGGDE